MFVFILFYFNMVNLETKKKYAFLSFYFFLQHATDLQFNILKQEIQQTYIPSSSLPPTTRTITTKKNPQTSFPSSPFPFSLLIFLYTIMSNKSNQQKTRKHLKKRRNKKKKSIFFLLLYIYIYI